MNEQERNRSFEHIEQIIVQQHFWFSATMLGVNGFLILRNSEPYSYYALIAVSILNLYAIFLIVSEAAAHADKIHFPKTITNIPQSQRIWKHKFVETRIRIKAAIKHIPFMIFELGKSLFYVLLILFSYLAFLLSCKFE